jgi:hypothetical protein
MSLFPSSTVEVNANTAHVTKNLGTEASIGNTPCTVGEHHCMDKNGQLYGPVGSSIKK